MEILSYFSEMLLGGLIVYVILYDVFQTVVVPRWTPQSYRPAPFLVARLWPVSRSIGLRMHSTERRENFLGAFAPLVLLLILMMWVLSLILGYALMLFALRIQIRPEIEDFGSALYLAGTGLLTIGFGDIVATGGLARVIILSAGASGLAVMALVISLMFTLHASFQRREILVLTLDDRGGVPPSGVMLLETFARYEMGNELVSTFHDWELWSAEVLESHRANPILPYFRSAHSDESWISALGAVLDAATLVLTTLEDGPKGAAHMLHGLGVHTILDLSSTFHLPRPKTVGVERREYDQARERLSFAGYRLKESEAAWEEFQKARITYAGPLNEMAKHFASPPTQWIGDRSAVSYLRHD